MLFFLLTYRLGEAQLVKIASPFLLDANNPAALLKKSLYRIEKDGKQIKSSQETDPGDNLDIYFSDGKIKVSVIEKEGGISF